MSLRDKLANWRTTTANTTTPEATDTETDDPRGDSTPSHSPTSEDSTRIPECDEDSSSSESDSEGLEYTVEPSLSKESLDFSGSRHQRTIVPGGIEVNPTSVRVGESWARTLWIGEFPDEPQDGLFEALYASPESRTTDISLHIQPRETEATLSALENQLEDLEADLEYLDEKRRASARGVQADFEDYRELYDVLRNTPTRAFGVSMYLGVREADSAHLRGVTDAVSSTARRAPTNLLPIMPRWQQLPALQSVSPLGVDALAESMDTTTPMLGGAFGAMYPFVSGAFSEPGIEYGTYALNESPLVVDRIERETGYCMLVIGQLGAGKSFSTKLQLVRRAMYDSDTILVMLDPLEGFASVNEALGGERITVGGTRGFNPLEIKATPPHIIQDVPDLDPWAEQVAWVLGFFETFFRDVAMNPLNGRTQTLRRAIQETYEAAGITRDPSTHDGASPTIRDLINVLEDLLEDPRRFGYVTEGEQENVLEDAQSLLTDLRPSFREGGDLSHLAQPTEFDLDAPVLYLDLHQEEGARSRGETSLLMQVLFNAVYERAKQTSKRVVFVIDEAHYLLSEDGARSFLETAVRHSRHYDLSLQFLTQTGGEFALTPEAKTIGRLCSMTLIHRVNEEASELAEWFDLNTREIEWVQSAKAGNDEDGYSEALLGIDGEGWFPLRVRASEYETTVISNPDALKEHSD
ncbi:VirB4 family type IV secretion system protein [Halobacterium wangiae]|uniref:VirB4 family type IV secretion system protein n=1 Tax=Halobacterium wangiae TaxID=2902623 RepID=UPI001E641615|nr:transfer complex protein [Halobacterium wangiae]